MVYETRWDFIRPYIEQKKVLDIGPAELVGTSNRDKLDRWLHGKMAHIATSLVGLEQNPEQVQALTALGYDIQQGSAEQFNLNTRFDVVVAGELIEHLSNPGLFLDCVQRHLIKGGKLLLTTPNRYGILSFYKVVRTGVIPVYEKPIAKHVAYFDSDALTSLLKRHGFKQIQIDYCKWVGTPRHGQEGQLVNLIGRYRPVMLNTLLAIAER